MPRPVLSETVLMGCPFSITAYRQEDEGLKEPYLGSVIHSAFAEVRRIENLLTEFRASPLNSINDMAGIRPAHMPRLIGRGSGGQFLIRSGRRKVPHAKVWLLNESTCRGYEIFNILIRLRGPLTNRLRRL